MTRGEHYDRVIQWVSQYQQSTGISPAIIWLFIDIANQKYWKTVAPTHKEDFLKSVVLSDGDLLPADWTVWAGSATYVDGGGKHRDVHYIHPGQLGYEINNSISKATAQFPGILFENMKFVTEPAGLTTFTVWYFNRPISMYSAVDDTIDDGMPSWTAGPVHEEAARSLMMLSDDEKKSDETLIRLQEESIKLNAELSPMLTGAMKAGYQSMIK